MYNLYKEYLEYFDWLDNQILLRSRDRKLEEANKKYDTVIPWYIMTSKENNSATVNFFEEHKYFGYPKGYIQFFKQGELPMVDTEGKILIG